MPDLRPLREMQDTRAEFLQVVGHKSSFAGANDKLRAAFIRHDSRHAGSQRLEHYIPISIGSGRKCKKSMLA